MGGITEMNQTSKEIPNLGQAPQVGKEHSQREATATQVALEALILWAILSHMRTMKDQIIGLTKIFKRSVGVVLVDHSVETVLTAVFQQLETMMELSTKPCLGQALTTSPHSMPRDK